MISKFDEFINEGDNSEEKRLNWIIDKISNFGESSLTPTEKDFLNNYQKGTTKVVSSESAHYNKFILSLLKDLKENNIKEEEAKKFVDKYLTKEDMLEFLVTLLKDNKLNFLLLNDIQEAIDNNKKFKVQTDEFKNMKGFWNVPPIKQKHKRGKFIKIPNFNKY